MTRQARRFGYPRLHLESVGSTMDVARDLAAGGAIEGTTVVADLQTAGIGRQGRKWEAPAGCALLCSVILRTETAIDRTGVLSPLVALAVIHTLDGIGVRDVTFKWPNDVLIRGQKVSGVLLTSRVVAAQHTHTLIAGIGLNLKSIPGLPATATFVAEHIATVPEKVVVLDALIGQIGSVYRQYNDNATIDLTEELGTRMALRGEVATVVDGDRTICGRVQGIDACGRLVLINKDGNLLTIVSGELTRGPQPG